MEKIHWGPNWEEILGSEFAKRSKDSNFEGVQKEIYGQFEKTFMMYLPRLCEHCLNPACVSACPSGAIYKRRSEEHTSELQSLMRNSFDVFCLNKKQNKAS